MANRLKATVSLIVALAAILMSACSGGASYSSESEMLSSIKGTYTCTDNQTLQYVRIADGSVSHTSKENGLKVDSYPIDSCDPKSGTITTEYGPTVRVLADGKIEYKDTVYTFGGTWPESNQEQPAQEPSQVQSQTQDSESQSSPFQLNEGTWENNSAYCVCNGSVTNVSNTTYRFIKVKGLFKDADGNTIDTDTTYACSDEGLAPGETTTFKLSVPRDSRIAGVSYKVYDYKL